MLERRTAANTDRDFLRRLYATTRPDLEGWDAAAREPFIDLQLRGQAQSWRNRFPDSADELILVDGQPAGRIWIAWLANEARVVDVALLPEHRRLGIGSAVIGETLAEADRRGMCVRLTVERLNHAAQAFWASFGFVPIAEDPVFLELERQPGTPAAS